MPTDNRQTNPVVVQVTQDKHRCRARERISLYEETRSTQYQYFLASSPKSNIIHLSIVRPVSDQQNAHCNSVRLFRKRRDAPLFVRGKHWTVTEPVALRNNCLTYTQSHIHIPCTWEKLTKPRAENYLKFCSKYAKQNLMKSNGVITSVILNLFLGHFVKWNMTRNYTLR